MLTQVTGKKTSVSRTDDQVKTQDFKVENGKRYSYPCQETCGVKTQIKDKDHKTCTVLEGSIDESKITSSKDKKAKNIADSKEEVKCTIRSETRSPSDVKTDGAKCVPAPAQTFPSKSNQQSGVKGSESASNTVQVQSANILEEKLKGKNTPDVSSQKVTKPVLDVGKKEIVPATKKQPQLTGTSSAGKQGLSSSKSKAKLEPSPATNQSTKATEGKGTQEVKAPVQVIIDHANLKPKERREPPLPTLKTQSQSENLPQTTSPQVGSVSVPTVKVHTPSGSPIGKGTASAVGTSKSPDSMQKGNRKDTQKPTGLVKDGAAPEKDSPRTKQSKDLPRGSNNKK